MDWLGTGELASSFWHVCMGISNSIAIFSVQNTSYLFDPPPSLISKKLEWKGKFWSFKIMWNWWWRHMLDPVSWKPSPLLGLSNMDYLLLRVGLHETVTRYRLESCVINSLIQFHMKRSTIKAYRSYFLISRGTEQSTWNHCVISGLHSLLTMQMNAQFTWKNEGYHASCGTLHVVSHFCIIFQGAKCKEKQKVCGSIS